MKTHDLARALTTLAAVLRRGPNVELGDWTLPVGPRLQSDSASVPVALSTLVALSRFDRNQWSALIKEFDLPVRIDPKNSSRDIVGKILRYLESSAEARNRLVHQASKNRAETSPELLRALESLLRK
jgi:hypothetical protein